MLVSLYFVYMCCSYDCFHMCFSPYMLFHMCFPMNCHVFPFFIYARFICVFLIFVSYAFVLCLPYVLSGVVFICVFLCVFPMRFSYVFLVCFPMFVPYGFPCVFPMVCPMLFSYVFPLYVHMFFPMCVSDIFFVCFFLCCFPVRLSYVANIFTVRVVFARVVLILTLCDYRVVCVARFVRISSVFICICLFAIASLIPVP